MKYATNIYVVPLEEAETLLVYYDHGQEKQVLILQLQYQQIKTNSPACLTTKDCDTKYLHCLRSLKHKAGNQKSRFLRLGFCKSKFCTFTFIGWSRGSSHLTPAVAANVKAFCKPCS